jgi:hypothetical protein
MPYVNPKAYLTTVDAFLAHWEAVDAALAPGNLNLGGTFGLAELQSARANLAAKSTLVVEETNRREGLATDRDQRRKALRDRIGQFRSLVGALLPGSAYEKALPKKPLVNAGQGVWLRALDETAALWADIEADAPPGAPVPFLVAGGYGLVDFSADSLALRNALTSLTAADQDVARAVDGREAVWKAVHPKLVQFRMAVAASFPLDHPLVTSLPRLSAPYRRRVKPPVPG